MPIDRATQAVIAELHRQGAARGVTVEDNGVSAQVDGAFPVQPLVLAVIAALRVPSSTMIQAAEEHARELDAQWDAGTTPEVVWPIMIDKLLEQRRP